MNIKIINNDGAYQSDKNTLINSSKYGVHEKVLLHNFNYDTYEEYKIGEEYHLRPVRDGDLSTNTLVTIGNGTFSNILWYAGSPIVFKKILKEEDETLLNLKCLTEICTLNSLKNICPRVYNINLTSTDCEIYMKKYEKDCAKGLKDGDLFNKEKKTIYNILKSIYHAQRLGFMHLDLKFENLLLDKDKNIVIADWGLSSFIPYSIKREKLVVTASYRAPEIYRSRPYDIGVDMFSCGIMFYELYYRLNHTIYHTNYTNFSDEKIVSHDKNIWDVKNFNRLLTKLYKIDLVDEMDECMIQKTYLNQIGDLSGILLCQQMTCSDPKIRPTFAEALNHPFFDDIREEKFEEMSYLDVLKNLRPLNTKGVNTDPSKKFVLFEWLADVCKDEKFDLNVMTYMLALRIINMYNKDDDSSYQFIGSACLTIASYLTGDDIDIEDIAYYSMTTNDVILTYIFDIFNYFKFDFYGSIPLMFIRDKEKITEEILVGLISIEIYYDKVRHMDNEVLADILQYDIIGEKSTDLWNILTQYRRNLRDMSMMVKIIKSLKCLSAYKPLTFSSRDHSKNNQFLNTAYTVLATKYDGDISPEIYTQNIREGITIIKDLLKESKMKFK